jgi:hypothetical protein
LIRELDSFVASNEAIKQNLDYKSRYANLKGKYESNLALSYKMRPAPMINFETKKAAFNTGFAVNSKFVNGLGLSGGAGFSSKGVSFSTSPTRNYFGLKSQSTS